MANLVKDQNPSFDKSLYWERRKRNLRGQIGYVNMHVTVKDEKGNDQLIPQGFKKIKEKKKRK